MAKQLNVNLAFTADTAQARAQLQSLQKQLSDLATVKSVNKMDLTKSIQEASTAAAQLKVHLEAATNTSTGKLDLSKFNASLKQSGMTLSDYQRQLSSLGSSGQQAFATLAQSVLQAEVSLRRSNGLLNNMWTSLKNTARWQLSSSILHGFMGTVQSAYGYAQDLNESLNNIRIVTGQNVDQMAKFADQANKAAKALSTTTTNYTNASLIYYQQGLNDQQVKERTDITVKMANVARTSAETVSDQMTAVWNNFYNGSKSLEYYADVMTALGAATASSTDEISEGLNKFAAVAETVGLSYEYAASALATITSNTRESADVVGNALKTLFARIQGLKLGETLEDGVDLNKYSKALDTVGIKVLDANGELKAMDILLEELAAKWDTISSAEQTALAQTVAGVRQYTQLIALMENWDNGDSDSMVANLATSYNSTGALQKQADIYAESWEAASKRVKASAQDIYDSILDDKFFIKITDGFADILDVISYLSDALGGMGGVVSTLGAVLLKAFGPQLSASLTDFINKLTFGKEKAMELKTEAAMASIRNTKGEVIPFGSVDQATKAPIVMNSATYKNTSINSAYEMQGKAQLLLLNNAEKLSDEEARIAALILDQNSNAVKLVETKAQALSLAERESKKVASNLNYSIEHLGNKEKGAKIRNAKTEYDQVLTKSAKMGQASAVLGTFSKNDIANAEELKNKIKELKSILGSLQNEAGKDLLNLDEENTDAEALKQNLIEIQAEVKKQEQLTDTALNAATTKFQKSASGTKFGEQIDDYIFKTGKVADAQVELTEANAQVAGSLGSLGSYLDNAGNKAYTAGEKIVSVAQALMSVTAAINAAKSIKEVWSNEDLTTGEKLLSTLTSISSVVPMLAMSFTGLNLKQMASASASLAAAMGFTGEAQAAVAAGTATAGFGVTLYTVLWPIGLIMAAIAALVGIFALLAKSIKESSAAFQLEELKKSAAELSDQLEDTKTAAEELANAFSTYDDVIARLDNCTKGTEEWYQAIKDVNAATAELIQKYPELNSYIDESGKKGVYVDPETGAQIVNENYFKDREEQLNKGMLATNAALFYNKGQQGHYEVATSNVAEDTRAKLATGVYGANLNGYDFNSADAIKDIQEIAKASVEGDAALQEVALKMAEKGYFAASDYKSYDEYAAAYGQDEVGNLRNSLQETANVFIDSLKSEGVIDNLADYSKLLDAPALAEKAYNDQTARMYLSTDKDIQDSKYRDQVLNASGDAYGQLMKQAIENLDSTWNEKDIETRFNEYTSAAGYSDYKFSKQKGDDVYYTVGDSTEEKKVDIDTMQATIAAAQALEKLGIAADQLMGKMTQLGSSTDIADQALISFLSQKNFESATKSEYEALLARSATTDNNLNGDIGIAEVGTEEVASYLGEKYGSDGVTLTDADAINYGYQSAEVMIEAFRQKIASTDDMWRDLKIPGAELFDWTDDLSLGAAKNLEAAIAKANLGPKGEAAGYELIGGLNKVLQQADVDIDDQSKVIEQLSNIDWSDWDALDQAQAIMKNLGYEIDLTSSEWLVFANNMRVANGAIPDFSNLKEDLISLSSILSGLQFGESISDEDYQKLIAYNEEWKSLFNTQADGSRQFIGNSEAMLDAQRHMISMKREEINTQKQAQEAFNNAGWSVDGKEITDWSTVSNQVGGAENLIASYKADGSAKGMMDALGYTPEDLQAQIDNINTAKAELAKAQENGDSTGTALWTQQLQQYEAQLQEFYNRVEQFSDTAYPDDADIEEMIASTATRIGELDSMLANSAIGVDTYDKALLGLASKYESCKTEIDAYQAVMANGTEEQKEAAKAALESSVRAGELGEQYGISSDEIERYAEELEMSGEYSEANSKALVEMAKDQKRYDKAVISAQKNMKKWEKDLDVAAETGHLVSETAEEMSEAYGDLLDIDGSSLSADFLHNTENLEDMKKAIEGDEEAYARLQARARQDIATKVGFDDSEFQAGFTDLMNKYYEGQNLDDLSVGASLDNADFLNALSDMVTQAGMTAQQATDYLSSMGIDAEVVNEPEEVEETVGYDLVPKITNKPAPYSPAAPSGGVGSAVATYPSVTYESTPVKVTKTVAGTALKVTSANKSSGGGVKHKGSTPAGGGSNSGKKGGGGGGGGSKAKDPKKASDEIERYHEIKEVISDLEREYDRINKARTRAFGMESIELMDQEIAKTQELIDAQKKYVAEIEANRDKDKTAIAAYGAKFDDQGRIINYDEIMSQQLAKFNASKTEAAEKAYEEFKKILEQYEETQNLLEEQEASLEELENRLYDEKLEKVQIEVELKLSVQDDQLTVLEHLLETMEDSAYDLAESLALMGREAEIYLNKSRVAQEGINKILAEHGGITLEQALDGGEQLGLTAEEIQALRDYRDEIIAANQGMLQLRQTAIDTVTNAFDSWNEQFSTQIEYLEHYTSVIESFTNIVDIVGKDILGISDEMMKNMSQATVDTSISTLEAQKKRMDALRKGEAELRDKLSKATSEEERKVLQEALDHIIAETNAAEEDMLASWEAALEAAAEAFEQAVETSISAFEKAISGTYGSLDGLQTAFDQASEVADRYVADYKEIYELSKLNRDINKSIDDTDNIKAKKALRDLEKEIVALQEKDVQMSEYDLDHLRAKYELRLAEIALEEAQNAKSQVRMRKDSEGNYSYVFTADADAVEKAQQNYEDKLYEMQELNSEYIKEMQNNILQSEIELTNALRDLDRAKFASDEEYYAEVNRLTAYYTGQRNYYIDEMNKGLTNNKETVDEDWKAYSDATGYKMSADKDYVDSFDETIYAQLTGYRSIEDAQNRFADATKVMVEDLKFAFTTWQTNTENAMKAAGTSIAEFGEDVQESIYGDGEDNKGIKGATEEAVTAMDDIAVAMAEAFGPEAMDAFANWAKDYAENMDPVIEQNKTLINQLNDLILLEAELDKDSREKEKEEEEIEEEEEEEIEEEEETTPTGPTTTNPHGKPSELSGNYYNYTTRAGVKAIQHALKEMGYDIGSSGIDGKFGSKTEAAVRAFQAANGITADGIVGPDTKAKFKAKGYLTGGLVDRTGWAWLDGTPTRPEYVLSADQTDAFIKMVENLRQVENLTKMAKLQEQQMMLAEQNSRHMLDSLDFIDNIMRVIELNAGAQAYGLGRIGVTPMTSGEQVIQQEITIHAEFPDATDHNEIEAAFDTLFVRASQFANRKN